MNEPWWCEGFIELFGEILYIFRIRNYNYPSGKYGYFHTSTIQNIEQKQENNKSFLILETKNSKYKVECVEEFKIHYNKGSKPEV